MPTRGAKAKKTKKPARAKKPVMKKPMQQSAAQGRNDWRQQTSPDWERNPQSMPTTPEHEHEEG